MLSVPAPGIISNDKDVEGNPLSSYMWLPPRHGDFGLNQDGSFDYYPDKNYCGQDTFAYYLIDGFGYSSFTNVAIDVTCFNRAPIANVYDAVIPANYAAPLDLSNYSFDPDADVITYSIVTAPTNGTVQLNPTTGQLTYTSAHPYQGLDFFIYKVQDPGGLSDTGKVTFDIYNVGPNASADNYTTSEDNCLTVNAANGVVKNDFDSNSDPMYVIIKSLPTQGTLVMNPDGSFVYCPSANFVGFDTFKYAVTDGIDTSNQTTVNITTTAVNDAPVAVDDYATVVGNSSLTASAAINDSDLEGDALTYKVIVAPLHGTVTMNANGGFVYTPALGFKGSDQFRYQLKDQPGALDTATVFINVLPPPNTAPTTVQNSYSVAEDNTLFINAPGILANDNDADGDALVPHLKSAPAHGSLIVNASGGFSYKPYADYFGSDVFTYAAYDGMAEGNVIELEKRNGIGNVVNVTINVTPINDDPLAVNDFYTCAANSYLVVNTPGVLVNDIDVDNDALTAVVTSAPSNGSLTFNSDGSFVYSPDAGYYGPDYFEYQVTDAAGITAIAYAYINYQNNPMVTSITRRDLNPTNAPKVEFLVVFNQAVTGVVASSFNLVQSTGLSGASITSIAAVPNSLGYIVTVGSYSGEGNLRLDMKNINGIVNANNDQVLSYNTGEVYTIDRIPPPVPVLTTPADGAIVKSRPFYSGSGAESGSVVTVYVDQQIQGTSVADQLGNWAFIQSTPLLDGVRQVKANARDAVGNVSAYSNENIITVDGSAPKAVFTSTEPPKTSNKVFTVNLSFSENVSGLSVSSFVVSNANITLVKISDQEYTLNVTAVVSGNVSVTLPENSVVDIAGNPNDIMTVFELIYNQSPVITAIAKDLCEVKTKDASLFYNFNVVDPEGLGLESVKVISAADSIIHIDKLTVDSTGTNYTLKYAQKATKDGIVKITITAIDKDGMQKTLSFLINVHPLPDVKLNHEGSVTACDNIDYKLIVPSGSGYTYTWISEDGQLGEKSNQFTVNKSGAYRVKVVTVDGCKDSSDFTFVEVVKGPDPATLTFANNTLTTIAGYKYVWYRNGVVIPGETTRTLKITQNGDYMVEIFGKNDCSEKSSVYKVTALGIAVNGSVMKVEVYPNPMNNVLTISSDKIGSYELMSADGKLLQKSNFAAGKTTLNTEQFAAGMYLLRLTVGSEIKTVKLLK